MGPDILFAIRYTYLTDPAATFKTLASQFDVGTHLIAQILSGPEYESIREQIHRTMTHTVRDRLHAASELASQKWIESFGPAALKGDHRPMRDLLVANKVVDIDKGIGTPVVIQIGVQAGSVTVAPVPVVPQVQVPSTGTGIPALPPAPSSTHLPPATAVPSAHVPVQSAGTKGTGTE